MAQKSLAIALSLFAAAPALAAGPDHDHGAAPAAGPDARYCMKVEPATGSRVEVIRCWTRAEWAEQGVDVDRDWAKEGVEVLG